jgi:head-tail adaptor
LKNLLNCTIATKYKQKADELAATKKWRDIVEIWAEYKGKPRKEAIANFRLKTGHENPAVHLRIIGIYINIMSAQFAK